MQLPPVELLLDASVRSVAAGTPRLTVAALLNAGSVVLRIFLVTLPSPARETVWGRLQLTQMWQNLSQMQHCVRLVRSLHASTLITMYRGQEG
jgi:hypothetical protein